MLRWRLISAAVILAVLLSLGWLDFRRAFQLPPGAWLFPALMIVSVLATEEVLSLLRAKNHRPTAWTVYLGNVAIPIAACLPLLFRAAGSEFPEGTLGAFGWPLVAFALGVVLVLACEMSRFGQAGSRIVDAALGIFALSYIGVLISFWALLRLAPGHRLGIVALFSMLLIVKMADTGAYFCGRMFGRTKMTPLLSPGKTWEGAAGGVVTACIISWLFFRFVAPAMVGSGYRAPALGAPLAYGALLAVAGMVGDLAESLLKREMDRKDSSTWLPGLGGVLDIIDAVLVAGPVAFVCWECGLLGPLG